MANLKSSLKDIRRIARRTERNGATRSKLKSLRKRVVADPSDANNVAYASAMDKAVKSGVVHKNKANREKSKIARKALQSKSRH